MKAIKYNLINTVITLISVGANLNIQDTQNNTALSLGMQIKKKNSLVLLFLNL